MIVKQILVLIWYWFNSQHKFCPFISQKVCQDEALMLFFLRISPQIPPPALPGHEALQREGLCSHPWSCGSRCPTVCSHRCPHHHSFALDTEEDLSCQKSPVTPVAKDLQIHSSFPSADTLLFSSPVLNPSSPAVLILMAFVYSCKSHLFPCFFFDMDDTTRDLWLVCLQPPCFWYSLRRYSLFQLCFSPQRAKLRGSYHCLF